MAKFELKALITGVDKLSPQLEGIRKNIAGFQKNISKAGFGKMSFSDLIAGGAFAAPFIAGAKAAIDFESQMADVRKVVDFDTPEQFKQMGDDILNMSKRLPMAAEGIAQIVAAGGQAGIAKEELARFAEDAVKMGVAFDTTAEESGDMMAKWRTSFKMTQDEVVNLADKINYLSNNGPARSGQISEIVTRIGSLGQVAGLASGEIAAMGATLAGIGIESEVSATGMKNFMLTMTAGASATNKQKQAFKALRLDSKQLAAGMQKDAKATMLDVLQRVSKVDPAKQAGLLTQLFGRESITAIAPLITNLDLLKKNLGMVADKTQYAGSMQKEYEARAATTANNIQLLKNQFKAAAINLGSIFLPAINDTLAVISPFASMLGDLIRDNPELIKAVALTGTSFIGMKFAIFGVSKALSFMNAVISLSPMGLLLRGIALAAGLIIANWETVGPFFKGVWDSITQGAGELLNLFRSLLGLDPVNWQGAWQDLGLIIDDLRAKTVGLIEKFIEYRDLVSSKLAVPAGFEEAGKNASAWQAYTPQQQARWAAPTVPTTQGAAAIVNPQAQKVNGEITVKFDNAPAGMRVEQTKTDSPVTLKTQQKVGRRNIGAN